jgi:hypothetical protein
VLVGDAPPHTGEGALCVRLAERGARGGWKTHVIQAEGEDVPHFADIAKAGDGQCVNLADGNSVIAEICGLTIGDRFRPQIDEFFQTYLALCR